MTLIATLEAGSTDDALPYRVAAKRVVVGKSLFSNIGF
jgi:hypothetical protein